MQTARAGEAAGRLRAAGGATRGLLSWVAMVKKWPPHSNGRQRELGAPSLQEASFSWGAPQLRNDFGRCCTLGERFLTVTPQHLIYVEDISGWHACSQVRTSSVFVQPGRELAPNGYRCTYKVNGEPRRSFSVEALVKFETISRDVALLENVPLQLIRNSCSM